MKKILLASIALVTMLSFLLAGCGTTGIAQEEYDRVVAQVGAAQQQVTLALEEAAELAAAKIEAEAALLTAQNDLKTARDEAAAARNDLTATQADLDVAEAAVAAAEAELADVQDDLDTALLRVVALEAQISGLEDEYEIVGETKAETAANIVRYYYDTHVYSATDMFVCGDMASEVWNMLLAQGIDSLIVIGDVDMAIDNILLSTHAWVLAEVEPGEYLALETTGGYTVTQSENPLYYQGWAFDSPADLKANNRLIEEYNVRVEIHNDIVDVDDEVLAEYEAEEVPAEYEKLAAVHYKLVEILDDMEVELNDINAEIINLATAINLN